VTKIKERALTVRQENEDTNKHFGIKTQINFIRELYSLIKRAQT
jgi:hypothetical protein